MSRMDEQFNQRVSELREKLNDSQMTTESDVNRYRAFATHKTSTGMIQSTIYHIRQLGKNIYDPEEKEKYFSEDFLKNQRHVNEKVEEELVDFKKEIDEKVEENTTKTFVFPRPLGEKIRLNTDSNKIDISHSFS